MPEAPPLGTGRGSGKQKERRRRQNYYYYCDAPAEIYKLPTSADGSCKSSEGFPTPVTSPLLPPKPPRTERRQYSWRNSSKREVCIYIRILKPLEIRKKKEELTFKNQESTNCQKAESRHPGSATDDGIKCDDIIASSNSDVTIRDTLWNVEVNRLIARKRYVPRKRSLTYSVGSFERSLKACSRIVTFIALFLAIVTNVLGGLINIKRYERKSTVGNSSSLPLSGPLSAISKRELLFFHLRKLSTIILVIYEELWPCMIIETNWKDNKRFKRRKEILHNSRNTNNFRPVIASPWLCNLRSRNVAKATFYLRSGNIAKATFLAGKCLSAYLCLFADFWASSIQYMIWIHIREILN